MTKAERVASGRFDGRMHVLPIRVYYEDTDFSGVVYHAKYLHFLERGRSEFLRAAGVRHQGMLKTEEPLVWVVRRMEIEYLKPARVDEDLQVRTAPYDLSGARLSVHQGVWRGAEQLVKAEVEACVITLDGKPRRIPDAVRRKLEKFVKA
ncbi:MAG: tol-pal system-associated acyl-CoA thioesterase [Alphaproteobacteria bacterium]